VLRVTVPQVPGVHVRTRRGGAAWEVSADGVHGLQQLAVASVADSEIRSLTVSVARWRPPVAGWLGRPGLPGVRELAVEPKGSGVRLRVEMANAVDPALLLAGAVRLLRPVATGDVGPMLTFTAGLPLTASCLTGRLHDVLRPDESRDAHVRRSDVLIVPAGDSGELPERRGTVHVTEGTWARDGLEFEVCIDPTVHRPMGRRSTGATDVASASASGDVVTIETAAGPVIVAHDVTPANAAALRGVRAVVADRVTGRVARQLHACGVIVAAADASLPSFDDDLAWQAWSVLERRHALRQFGPTGALDAWPTVSVLLVTNRPDHLEHAMRQLSGLRYPRLEVVVGVHGDRVDVARVREAAQDVPHPVAIHAIDGSCTLGEALQTCSDRAQGALITKMDDDDFYGAEHIWDLVLAREYSGAQIVGKALDWIFVESRNTTAFRPTYPAEKYADFVAGGTILVSRADLNAVGGWRPVPKSVDRALLDRMLADGGLVYRTHGLGYVYVRHSAGHTASVKDEHFLSRTTSTHAGLIRHEAFGTAGHLPTDPPP
jgi:hypothetical protein